MDLLDEKEELGSRVNTIIMGLASLCQQCLLTGKALWDGAICRKMGEMEFKIRAWEMLRLRSCKPRQQLGRQTWMRAERGCCSKKPPELMVYSYGPIPWGKKRCSELCQLLPDEMSCSRGWEPKELAQEWHSSDASCTDIFEQIQFLNKSLPQY